MPKSFSFNLEILQQEKNAAVLFGYKYSFSLNSFSFVKFVNPQFASNQIAVAEAISSYNHFLNLLS